MFLYVKIFLGHFSGHFWTNWDTLTGAGGVSRYVYILVHLARASRRPYLRPVSWKYKYTREPQTGRRLRYYKAVDGSGVGFKGRPCITNMGDVGVHIQCSLILDGCLIQAAPQAWHLSWRGVRASIAFVSPLSRPRPRKHGIWGQMPLVKAPALIPYALRGSSAKRKSPRLGAVVYGISTGRHIVRRTLIGSLCGPAQ